MSQNLCKLPLATLETSSQGAGWLCFSRTPGKRPDPTKQCSFVCQAPVCPSPASVPGSPSYSSSHLRVAGLALAELAGSMYVCASPQVCELISLSFFAVY